MPRDIKVNLGDNVLQRGCVLKDDVVMGRLYGNSEGPVIVVMGGISASRFIADAEIKTTRNNGRGWWSTLVREGGPIDLANSAWISRQPWKAIIARIVSRPMTKRRGLRSS